MTTNKTLLYMSNTFVFKNILYCNIKIQIWLTDKYGSKCYEPVSGNCLSLYAMTASPPAFSADCFLTVLISCSSLDYKCTNINSGYCFATPAGYPDDNTETYSSPPPPQFTFFTTVLME